MRKYFIAVEKKYNRKQIPMTVPEQIQLLAMGNVELNQKVDNLDKRLSSWNMIFRFLASRSTESRRQRKERRGVPGRKEQRGVCRSITPRKVYNDIYRELKRQFGVTTYKAIKRNQCDMAVEIISGYQLPYVLADQVQYRNAQENLWGGVRA